MKGPVHGQRFCCPAVWPLLRCNRHFKALLTMSTMALALVVVYILYVSPKRTSSSTFHQLLSGNGAELIDSNAFDHFDNQHDVLVFLHIQKTGGSTFGRHVAKDSVGFPSECRRLSRKRGDCRDSHGHFWLFSRVSAGWACGLHADWTELHECVPTMLDKLEKKHRDRRLIGFIIHLFAILKEN